LILEIDSRLEHSGRFLQLLIHSVGDVPAAQFRQKAKDELGRLKSDLGSILKKSMLAKKILAYFIVVSHEISSKNSYKHFVSFMALKSKNRIF
jgi:hypothetical protein